MSQMGQKRTSGVHFCNVRFTPKSGYRGVRSPCPLSAKSGHYVEGILGGSTR